MMITLKLIVVLLVIISMTVIITYIIHNTSKKNPCEIWDSVKLFSKKRNTDGSIKSDNITYKAHEILEYNDSLRGCVCLKTPCLRKCCSNNYSFKRIDGKIECTDNYKDVSFSKLKYYKSGSMKEEVIGHKVKIVNHDLISYCKNELLTNVTNYKLLTNGSILQINNKNKNTLIYMDDYCADLMDGTINFFICQHGKKDSVIYEDIRLELYTVCMQLSLPFLTITFLVYCFIPDLQNLVGKSFSSLTFMQSISYILLTITQMKGKAIANTVFCVPLGYLMQYSLLSTFFWLNIMCFDIWLVFSTNALSRNRTKYDEIKRFVKYGLYAWGVPAIITLITFIANNMLPTKSGYRPMVGDEYYCQITSNNKSKLIFFYLPLAVLFILNTVMFFMTAYQIYEHKKRMTVLKNRGSRILNKKEKERLNLYFKLFLVMGITWAAEPVSTFFDEKPALLWIFIDVINLLQPVLIFMLFICKRRILYAINAKLYPSKNLFDHTSSGIFNSEPRNSQPASTITTSRSTKNTNDKEDRRNSKNDKVQISLIENNG